ncbi:hypothetical protein TSUD_289220 [Trifolium subterraneum]|uniref:Uncharacterized protein n=1 Tax=Trifolium subterraneum TaxID=3900 RepID=A0A2Z6M4H2_TRISU|nr:hypothetical protein TSUD_289220 [Trifolium subterraneum]
MSTSTDHHEEEDVPAGEDEDTGAQVAPIVRLEEVAVSTGEEDEEVILDLDFADGELKDELFCIRFASIERVVGLDADSKMDYGSRVSTSSMLGMGDCKKFIETFQEIAESQNKEENADASAAAVLLENLSVEGKSDAEKKVEEKSEDKTKEQESAAPEKESKEDSEKKVEESASSA